jgi:hypothetical protein
MESVIGPETLQLWRAACGVRAGERVHIPDEAALAIALPKVTMEIKVFHLCIISYIKCLMKYPRTRDFEKLTSFFSSSVQLVTLWLIT